MTDDNHDIIYRVTLQPGNYEVFQVSPEIVAAVNAECGHLDSDIWCECDYAGNAVDYRGDGECECGIEKHHYHCPKCGGVSQIG